MQLDTFDFLPGELAALGPRDIRQVFPNPALIRIPGRRPEPLFLSTLLHGNETTSFYVLQDLATRYASTLPPRSLLMFVGNVEAAAVGMRRMNHQEDFNRIWAGGQGELFDLARTVIAAARAAQPFASIDIHNNTGANPFYGCVNTLAAQSLNLAAMFSRIAVYYRNPPTTQSMAFSSICPAITVECGRVGNVSGTERAIQFVNDALHLEHLPDRAPPAHDLALFETVGRVLIEPHCSFSFSAAAADLLLRADLEQKNFSPMMVGEEWGQTRCMQLPLRVVDEAGDDHTSEFFELAGTAVRLRRAITPAMLTSHPDIIRQDCLGYVMTPLALTS